MTEKARKKGKGGVPVREALRESEQRYRRLLESVTDYIYTVFIEDGRVARTTHGPGCAGVTGYSPEEYAADPYLWLEMVHEDDRDLVTSHASRLLEEKNPRPLEHRIIHKNGSVIWVRNTPVQHFDEDGRLVSYDALIVDITERKNAEDALKAGEEKFRLLFEEFNALLDAIPDDVALYTPDLRLIWTNRAVADRLGRTTEDISGAFCYKIMYDRDAPCSECAVIESLLSGKPSTQTLHGAFDQIWDIRALPLKDSSKNVTKVVQVRRNVTERRRLEEQLRQAQKMEAVGLLAGGVAHDFNNILSAIVGYGSLLQMKTPEDDPRRHNVDQILSAAEKATWLTQSLLAFSRKQIINPKPVDLNEIVRRIEKLLRRLIGEDVELATITSPEPATVMADTGQIEQVIMNLATNARDSMPDGGSITIRIREVDSSEIRCDDFLMSIPSEEVDEKRHRFNSPFAELSVTDTGHGMDSATAGRIFEPFFTTKELGRGTGLGLSIVYGIVRQHNGYIDVESEQGRGTSIKLYFPLLRENCYAAADAEFDMPGVIGGSETVLVAEDDKVVRKLTREVLTGFGYKVIEAEDGERAAEIYRELSGDIDLLLFDVIMPRKNGTEAYEEIRKMNPAVKILFMSGYTSDIMHKKGLMEKGVHLLMKPVAPHLLLSRIREVLDGD